MSKEVDSMGRGGWLAANFRAAITITILTNLVGPIPQLKKPRVLYEILGMC